MDDSPLPLPPLEILYQDETLVAVHKPSGLLVHRSDVARHEHVFAVQLLRDQLGCRVYPVHRLDRGTSGVLLFALDTEAAGRLGRDFEQQQVGKRYLAVVRGHPPEESLIDHALGLPPDPYLGTRQAAPQPARTRYRRLACAEIPVQVDRYPSSRYALLELEPETGRRNQLRRHLKHIAHPIIGDATYGKGIHNRFFASHFGCGRMLLACTMLGFRHPRNGRWITVSAPPDGEFLNLIRALDWPLPSLDPAALMPIA